MHRKATQEAVTIQRDGLRKILNAHGRWEMKPAAIALALLGVVVLAFWFLTNDGSTMAMLVMLTGVAVMVIAILLYFLSPSRFLRGEVADALTLSSVRNIDKMLSVLLIEAHGIYVPASQAGTARVFFPASGSASRVPLVDGVFVAEEDSKGIQLDPPGHDLLIYARQIGATFTDERLESELPDVMENALELAAKVEVRREGDNIMHVSMSDLANAGMCRTLRKERLWLCTQVGCPVCSFVACALAEATGRQVVSPT